MTLWKSPAKKFQVKVNGMRLEGLKIEPKDRVIIGIEIKWEGQGVSKSGFSRFNRKSQKISTNTTSNDIKLLKLDEFEFGYDCDEFVHVCSFSIVSKDPISFAPWIVSFNILSGKSEESSTSSSSPTRETLQEIGKVGLNLGELASKMESQIEQKIPVVLQVNGVAMEVILRVVVGFVEMKNGSHSRSTSQDVSGLSPHDSSILLRRAMSQGPSLGREKAKKNKIRFFGKQWGSRITEESSPTVSSESEDMALASSSKNSDTQSELVKKNEFWKFNRRKSKKNKVESFETKLETTDQKIRPKSGSWESRKLVCRDGKTKLKADIFLASYDQRDEQAAGESACAAIVAVIAHWLLSNPGKMPTGPDLDRLITEGSTEWRKLCEDESHKAEFPNQHFDLETILQAGIRPLAVLLDHSRFGFFHPEEFKDLQYTLSFDDIWDEINHNTLQHESRVYIIRWNEHFFVLKVDKEANYIVDSLGERLCEGCNQAYILKFDDSTVMYQKDDEKGQEKVICQGKDCCREYMRRFLAAIPLRELKEQNQQGKTMNVSALCQRLMIDFHLSSPSTSPADSSTDSTANTSPANCIV